MSKGILIAMGYVLSLCVSMAQAQEVVPRYRVTYAKNFTAGGANETRSATVVTV